MEKFGSGMEKSRIRDKHPGSTTLEPTLPEEDECRHGGNAVSSSGVLALVHVNLRATSAIRNTLAWRDPESGYAFIPSKQCGGSVTSWCGSGSVDLYLWLMDPAPFFSDFKDTNFFCHIFILWLTRRHIIWTVLSGSKPLINRSGSVRPKNMRIWIPNTASKIFRSNSGIGRRNRTSRYQKDMSTKWWTKLTAF